MESSEGTGAPDRIVDEETEAAAAEAGAIGGTAGDEGMDPAERPLAEAGQGEAEGFEQAEEALVQAATHGDPAADPTRHAGEPEDARGEGIHSEPDHVDVSEVTSDPAEEER